MKKRIYHMITVLLLGVYSIFSTGIFISIHHCCNHCESSVTVETCACMDEGAVHEHSSLCTDSHAEHHKCHDDHLFFKIGDEHDKCSELPSVNAFLSVLYSIEFHIDSYLNNLYTTIIKSNKRLPSHPVIQGESFFEYSQQLVLYS